MERTEHVWYECRCRRTSCPFCEGSLGVCTVCKGAEGTLPRDCPGKPISAEDQELIYKGTLDFRDGQWVNRPVERWEKPSECTLEMVNEAISRLNAERSDTLDAITEFRGPYRFLSNFAACTIWHDGLRYPSVEHAFQAAKTLNFANRQRIANLSLPSEAKKAGRQLTLRPDWELARNAVMWELVLQKFVAVAEYRSRLLATGDRELIEGNTWGDTYWGVCHGVGENVLGRTLMSVREILKK